MEHRSGLAEGSLYTMKRYAVAGRASPVSPEPAEGRMREGAYRLTEMDDRVQNANEFRSTSVETALPCAGVVFYEAG